MSNADLDPGWTFWYGSVTLNSKCQEGKAPWWCDACPWRRKVTRTPLKWWRTWTSSTPWAPSRRLSNFRTWASLAILS
jgi:hypothetical protein